MAASIVVDVGTGSVRAALVDEPARILGIASELQAQITPRFGWSEQRPRDWWAGAVASLRRLAGSHADGVRDARCIVVCGQMHGTVLVDAAGDPVREAAPLWNDKRTLDLVEAFEAAVPAVRYLPLSANPATPAWPAFKLQWIRRNEPQRFARARALMMPKDYVNYRLCGEIAMDFTEAACSFMMDPAGGGWSAELLRLLDLPAEILPPIRMPTDVLGTVGAAAAAETGLRAGLPVLVGAGDYPAALLGSGVIGPGLASEVMGTSSILTLMSERPLVHPTICNVGAVDGRWGGFMLLESGGDAMRWGQRALGGGAETYAEFVTSAAEAPAGSRGLVFTPFLMGERLGAQRNKRAQLYGLAAIHGPAELRRAVLEGVAFGVRQYLDLLEATAGTRVERIVASGGGARARLWLEIKASIYERPIAVPEEAESSIAGGAMLAGLAFGDYASLADAAAACVRHSEVVDPIPAWAAVYRELRPVFETIQAGDSALWARLDALQSSEAAPDVTQEGEAGRVS